MTGSLVAGAVVGLGLLLIMRGIVPTPEPLPALLNRLTTVAPSQDYSQEAHRPLVRRVGSPLVRIAEGLGLSMTSLRRDLAVVGRPLEVHFATKAASAAFMATLPIATAGVIAVGGVALPAVMTLWLAAALGLVGFFVPDALARAEAEERRRDLRHALSAFLDLVVVVLAAGGGVQSALVMAAATGDGWAFVQIRRALDEARIRREPAWDAIARLGEELDVAELRELAASVGLAGTEGARVRESLSAKAASLRAHALAELEADAGMATERMSFPVALLAFGFFGLIGYPAVVSVLHGI